MQNFKTKANRVGTQSLAMLALRIIETVIKSAIQEARISKQFLILEEVNSRYQIAVEPASKEVSEAIKALFNERKTLFGDIFDYLEGLLKSPDLDMKAAGTLLFGVLNKFGKSYGSFKIADQSLRYIRIIEALKRPEYTAALIKTSLTDKLAQFDELQLSYEDLYMGSGNDSAARIAPSNLRREMEVAIKMYVDELKWLANAAGTEAWNTLYMNVEQRFNEVNVSLVRKKTAKPAPESATTNAPANAPANGTAIEVQ